MPNEESPHKHLSTASMKGKVAARTTETDSPIFFEWDKKSEDKRARVALGKKSYYIKPVFLATSSEVKLSTKQHFEI